MVSAGCGREQSLGKPTSLRPLIIIISKRPARCAAVSISQWAEALRRSIDRGAALFSFFLPRPAERLRHYPNPNKQKRLAHGCGCGVSLWHVAAGRHGPGRRRRHLRGCLVSTSPPAGARATPLLHFGDGVAEDGLIARLAGRDGRRSRSPSSNRCPQIGTVPRRQDV